MSNGNNQATKSGISEVRSEARVAETDANRWGTVLSVLTDLRASLDRGAEDVSGYTRRANTATEAFRRVLTGGRDGSPSTRRGELGYVRSTTVNDGPGANADGSSTDFFTYARTLIADVAELNGLYPGSSGSEFTLPMDFVDEFRSYLDGNGGVTWRDVVGVDGSNGFGDALVDAVKNYNYDTRPFDELVSLIEVATRAALAHRDDRWAALNNDFDGNGDRTDEGLVQQFATLDPYDNAQDGPVFGLQENPIAMLPVDLQTRFDPPGEDTAPTELLIRIYPDDVHVDAHEPELTRTEERWGKVFWTQVYLARLPTAPSPAPGRPFVDTGGTPETPDDDATPLETLLPSKQRAPVVRRQVSVLFRDTGEGTTIESFSEDLERRYREVKERAWGLLVERLGEQRAAHVLEATAPVDRSGGTDPATATTILSGPTDHGYSDLAREVPELRFPAVDYRPGTLTRQVRARFLPDRFTAKLYYETSSGDERFVTIDAENAVREPLFLGPDPETVDVAKNDADTQAPGDGGKRDDGSDPDGPGKGRVETDPDTAMDVVAGGMEWMVDFEAARRAGMAIRVDLSELDGFDPSRGFRKVVVTGVKASMGPSESTDALEELLDVHHHTHGLELLAAGTPTNNHEGGSGYSRSDDPVESVEYAAGPPLAARSDAPAADAVEGTDATDGSVLGWGLGVLPDPDDDHAFAHVEGAGRTDWLDSLQMQSVLWPGTLGYYLRHVLVPRPMIYGGADPRESTAWRIHDALRDHFTRFVRADGPFPALRVGDQPYGVLPATSLQDHDENDAWAGDPTDAYYFVYRAVTWLRQFWEDSLGNVPKIPGVGDQPFAAFTVSEGRIPTGASVEVDASPSVAPGGSVRSYEWDFAAEIDRTVSPESTNSGGKEASYSYGSEGVRTIELTVTDEDGNVATATRTVTVDDDATAGDGSGANDGGGTTDLSEPVRNVLERGSVATAFERRQFYRERADAGPDDSGRLAKTPLGKDLEALGVSLDPRLGDFEYVDSRESDAAPPKARFKRIPPATPTSAAALGAMTNADTTDLLRLGYDPHFERSGYIAWQLYGTDAESRWFGRNPDPNTTLSFDTAGDIFGDVRLELELEKWLKNGGSKPAVPLYHVVEPVGLGDKSRLRRWVDGVFGDGVAESVVRNTVRRLLIDGDVDPNSLSASDCFEALQVYLVHALDEYLGEGTYSVLDDIHHDFDGGDYDTIDLKTNQYDGHRFTRWDLNNSGGGVDSIQEAVENILFNQLGSPDDINNARSEAGKLVNLFDALERSVQEELASGETPVDTSEVPELNRILVRYMLDEHFSDYYVLASAVRSSFDDGDSRFKAGSFRPTGLGPTGSTATILDEKRELDLSPINQLIHYSAMNADLAAIERNVDVPPEDGTAGLGTRPLYGLYGESTPPEVRNEFGANEWHEALDDWRDPVHAGFSGREPVDDRFAAFQAGLHWMEGAGDQEEDTPEGWFGPDRREETRRRFAGTMDLASHRLDAWWTSLATRRLMELRAGSGPAFDADPNDLWKDTMEAGEEEPLDPSGLSLPVPAGRTGTYIGAYGFVENLTPQSRDASGDATEFPDNEYVLAPSLAHARTAAILRSGRRSHPSGEFGELMTVDLSPGRVDTARWLLDGLRSGLLFGELLGYAFERRLGEASRENSNVDLERYRTEFRKEFPLSEGKIDRDGSGGDGGARTERLDVVNGYLLYKRVAERGVERVVDGLKLEQLGTEEKDLLIDAIDEVVDAVDALSDLITAENVFQLQGGNYSQAGRTLKAMAEGKPPRKLGMLDAHRDRTGLTHRLLVLFSVDLDLEGEAATPPSEWQRRQQGRNETITVPEVDANGELVVENGEPRTDDQVLPVRDRGAPVLNAFAGRLFPPPGEVACLARYEWGPEDDRERHETGVTFDDLRLTPLDALYLTQESQQSASSKLEAQARFYLLRNRPGSNGPDVPPDAAVELEFDKTPPNRPDAMAWGQFVELSRSLRDLVGEARAADATDLSHPGEEAGSDGVKTEAVETPADELSEELLNVRRTVANRVELLTGESVPVPPLLTDVSDLAGIGRTVETASNLEDYDAPDTTEVPSSLLSGSGSGSSTPGGGSGGTTSRSAGSSGGSGSGTDLDLSAYTELGAELETVVTRARSYTDSIDAVDAEAALGAGRNSPAPDGDEFLADLRSLRDLLPAGPTDPGAVTERYTLPVGRGTVAGELPVAGADAYVEPGQVTVRGDCPEEPVSEVRVEGPGVSERVSARSTDGTFTASVDLSAAGGDPFGTYRVRPLAPDARVTAVSPASSVVEVADGLESVTLGLVPPGAAGPIAGGSATVSVRVVSDSRSERFDRRVDGVAVAPSGEFEATVELGALGSSPQPGTRFLVLAEYAAGGETHTFELGAGRVVQEGFTDGFDGAVANLNTLTRLLWLEPRTEGFDTGRETPAGRLETALGEVDWELLDRERRLMPEGGSGTDDLNGTTFDPPLQDAADALLDLESVDTAAAREAVAGSEERGVVTQLRRSGAADAVTAVGTNGAYGEASYYPGGEGPALADARARVDAFLADPRPDHPRWSLDEDLFDLSPALVQHFEGREDTVDANLELVRGLMTDRHWSEGVERGGGSTGTLLGRFVEDPDATRRRVDGVLAEESSAGGDRTVRPAAVWGLSEDLRAVAEGLRTAPEALRRDMTEFDVVDSEEDLSVLSRALEAVAEDLADYEGPPTRPDGLRNRFARSGGSHPRDALEVLAGVARARDYPELLSAFVDDPEGMERRMERVLGDEGAAQPETIRRLGADIESFVATLRADRERRDRLLSLDTVERPAEGRSLAGTLGPFADALKTYQGPAADLETLTSRVARHRSPFATFRELTEDGEFPTLLRRVFNDEAGAVDRRIDDVLRDDDRVPAGTVRGLAADVRELSRAADESPGAFTVLDSVDDGSEARELRGTLSKVADALDAREAPAVERDDVLDRVDVSEGFRAFIELVEDPAWGPDTLSEVVDDPVRTFRRANAVLYHGDAAGLGVVDDLVDDVRSLARAAASDDRQAAMTAFESVAGPADALALSETLERAADVLNDYDPTASGDDTGRSELVGRFDDHVAMLSDQVGYVAAATREPNPADAFREGLLETLRRPMLRAAYFGVFGAVPEAASGGSAAVAEDLVRQALTVVRRVDERLAAEAALDADADDADEHVDRLSALFDTEFTVLPPFKPHNATEVARTFRNDLLPDRGQSANEADPRPVHTWLQRSARTRERPGMLRETLTYGSAVGGEDMLTFEVGQLPHYERDTWVGADGVTPQEPGRVSIVAHTDAEFDRAVSQRGDGREAIAGLFVDEWTEEVPEPEENAALSFRYDVPSNEPPGAILLATPPKNPGAFPWTPETLSNTVEETLDLMRYRGVDLEALVPSDETRRNAIGDLLPALFLGHDTHLQPNSPTVDFTPFEVLERLRGAYERDMESQSQRGEGGVDSKSEDRFTAAEIVRALRGPASNGDGSGSSNGGGSGGGSE